MQVNKVTQSLRNACTKRTLQMLEKLSNNDNDKYQAFWNEFGQVLKEGLAEDFQIKKKLQTY